MDYNPLQEDEDEDGDGDICDNCPDVYNPDQDDTDLACVGGTMIQCSCSSPAECGGHDCVGDGVGDACDPCPDDNPDDWDCDGVCNSDDHCPRVDNDVDCDGDYVGDCDEIEADPSLDCNGDSLLDACDPVLAPANRYLTVIPPAGVGQISLKVTASCGRSSPDLGWVGQPYLKNGDYVARAGEAEPYCMDRDDWCGVLITGDFVIPETTYNVYYDLCGDPIILQGIGSATTPMYGDVVGAKVCSVWGPPDGYRNIYDQMVWSHVFHGHCDAPPWYWVDVATCGPDEVINVSDLQWISLAFQGHPWPEWCSDPCE